MRRHVVLRIAVAAFLVLTSASTVLAYCKEKGWERAYTRADSAVVEDSCRLLNRSGVSDSRWFFRYYIEDVGGRLAKADTVGAKRAMRIMLNIMFSRQWAAVQTTEDARCSYWRFKPDDGYLLTVLDYYRTLVDSVWWHIHGNSLISVSVITILPDGLYCLYAFRTHAGDTSPANPTWTEALPDIGSDYYGMTEYNPFFDGVAVLKAKQPTRPPGARELPGTKFCMAEVGNWLVFCTPSGTRLYAVPTFKAVKPE
ncbi:MAG: hypothetical protein V1685_07270 [Parcubacteria group bacterium]